MFDAPTSLSNEIPSGHNGNIKILAQQPTTNTFASGGEDGYINIYTSFKFFYISLILMI